MSRFFPLTTAAAIAVVIGSAFISSPVLAATSYPVNLKATASGANEGAGKGSPIGSASATFVVNVSRGTICYNIKYKRLAGVNGVHIHKGAAGTEGPVVVAMSVKRFNKSGNACVKETPAVLSAIAMNPASYYFNLHTPAFPVGAVRGQLQGMLGTKKAPVKKAPVTKAPVTAAPTTNAPSPKTGY